MSSQKITIQSTNNKNILKFVSTQILINGGSYEYNNIDDAKEKAKEIGCVGTHKMDKDGKTIYMPCKTHDAYEEAISKGYGDEEDKYHKKPKNNFILRN